MANRSLLDKENHCIYIACEGFQAEMWRVGMPQGRGRDGRTSRFFRTAHLAHVHLVSVFARRGAIGGEDGCAVAVGVPVDDTDGIIQGVRLQNHQHRPEDLFSVALHVRLPEHKQSHAAMYVGGGLGWGTEMHLETRTVTLPMMVGPTK